MRNVSTHAVRQSIATFPRILRDYYARALQGILESIDSSPQSGENRANILQIVILSIRRLTNLEIAKAIAVGVGQDLDEGMKEFVNFDIEALLRTESAPWPSSVWII